MVKLKREQSRYFSAHNTLMNIANIELDKAIKKEAGYINHALIAITFSALAVEALANAIGEKVISNWEDFESMNPNAKIRYLAEHQNVPYDLKKDPWKTLKDLSSFRNKIAHAKPELIFEEKIITQEEFEKNRMNGPEAALEKMITIGFAKRAVESFESAKNILCDSIEDRAKTFGLYTDGWSGSASVHVEKQ